VIVATVVPPPTKRSLQVVKEYQEAIEKQTGKKEYSSPRSNPHRREVAVEALRRAGAHPSAKPSCGNWTPAELRRRRLPRELLPANHNAAPSSS